MVTKMKQCWNLRLSEIWWVQFPLRTAKILPNFGIGLSDGLYLLTWPTLSALSPIIALLIGFVAGGFYHERTFTYSLLLISVLIIIGILSVQLGFWGIIGYAAGDFLLQKQPRASNYWEALVEVRLPLLLSYLLLGLVVVIVPLIGMFVRSAIRKKVSLPSALRLVVEILGFILVLGASIYIWANAMAVLIRPIFTWQGGQPTEAAIAPLQNQNWVLIGVAAFIGCGRILFENSTFSSRVERIATILELAFPMVIVKKNENKILTFVGFVLSALGLTLLISGMITGVIQGIIVFIFFALLLWFRHSLRVVKWGWLNYIFKIPAIIRFGIGLALSYFLIHLIINKMWSTDNTFLPVLICTCLSVMIMILFSINRKEFITKI